MKDLPDNYTRKNENENNAVCKLVELTESESEMKGEEQFGVVIESNNESAPEKQEPAKEEKEPEEKKIDVAVTLIKFVVINCKNDT